ncbi:MAG: hypothetical protein NVSMB47_11730 [Polyangiales bacterium]
MARGSWADRIRRWLRARPTRWAFGGGLGLAVLSLSSIALAQEHKPAAEMQQGAPPHDGVAGGPIQHPPAESAKADLEAPKHEGAGAEGEPEGAEEGEHHHGVEPFNFANFQRYGQEKDEAAKGHGVPVTPYIYVLINALVLYAIYYYAGKKPVSEGLKSRRDTIAKELDEAAKIKAEAQAKLDEYTERLDKLDHELDRMRQELILAGEKDRDRIVREAEEKAERMRKDAQFLLDQELKQLRLDLLAHTVEAAVRAAEGALQSKVSPQDQDRLADEYVTMLGKLPEPGARGAVTPVKPSPGGAS